VAVVDLVVQLFAGEHDLFGVDDDHMVAGVHMRRIDRLMLAPKNRRNLAGQTAENSAVSVHNVPVAFEGFAFCHIGFHRLVSS